MTKAKWIIKIHTQPNWKATPIHLTTCTFSFYQIWLTCNISFISGTLVEMLSQFWRKETSTACHPCKSCKYACTSVYTCSAFTVNLQGSQWSSRKATKLTDQLLAFQFKLVSHFPPPPKFSDAIILIIISILISKITYMLILLVFSSPEVKAWVSFSDQNFNKFLSRTTWPCR